VLISIMYNVSNEFRPNKMNDLTDGLNSRGIDNSSQSRSSISVCMASNRAFVQNPDAFQGSGIFAPISQRTNTRKAIGILFSRRKIGFLEVICFIVGVRIKGQLPGNKSHNSYCVLPCSCSHL